MTTLEDPHATSQTTNGSRRASRKRSDVDGSNANAPRRLVVELNTHTAEDLSYLVELEQLNKTNVVNRAVQVYRMVMEAQHNGGSITIHDPARGEPERLRVV